MWANYRHISLSFHKAKVALVYCYHIYNTHMLLHRNCRIMSNRYHHTSEWLTAVIKRKVAWFYMKSRYPAETMQPLLVLQRLIPILAIPVTRYGRRWLVCCHGWHAELYHAIVYAPSWRTSFSWSLPECTHWIIIWSRNGTSVIRGWASIQQRKVLTDFTHASNLVIRIMLRVLEQTNIQFAWKSHVIRANSKMTAKWQLPIRDLFVSFSN